MALTPQDRRNTISQTISSIMDLRDELGRLGIDSDYASGRIKIALNLMRTIDKDGPAPASIALMLTEEARANCAEGTGSSESLAKALAEIRSLADTVSHFDAIPGVYPYPCDVLTFSDESQCLMPTENNRGDNLPWHLAEHYDLQDDYFFGHSMPIVRTEDMTSPDRTKAMVDDILLHAYSDNARLNYGSRLKKWVEFADANNVPVMPARASDVANWLEYQVNEEGKTIGTIIFGLQALKTIHKRLKQPHPCDEKEVRDTLSRLSRQHGTAPDQVDALTIVEVNAIEDTACLPRRSRGGKLETKEFACLRGCQDIALVKTLHAGLLRPNEAVNLKQRDLRVTQDGSGVLFIASSKTDQNRQGATQYIPADTVQAILRIGGRAEPDDFIFDFDKRTLSRRIQAAAKAAGLVGRFAGQSGRIGMARDLVAAGASLVEIMQAGRWKSAKMPAYYARNELAGRSAVARFHKRQEDAQNA